MKNEDKIILDLCGGTGAWSDPYATAGYDRRIITSPEQDVLTYRPPPVVYGVLAAPPCTEFASSGTRWWKSKPPRLLEEALAVVRVCLSIIEQCQPEWWALENPIGQLPRYIGKYRYTFQPWEYGDPWTKRTCIWGDHNIPIKTPVEPVGTWMGSHAAGKPLGIVDHPGLLIPSDSVFLPPDWVHRMAPGHNRAMLRAITPPGFARAFYEANK